MNKKRHKKQSIQIFLVSKILPKPCTWRCACRRLNGNVAQLWGNFYLGAISKKNCSAPQSPYTFVTKGLSFCLISQMFGKHKFRKSVNSIICQIAAFTLFPNLGFQNIQETSGRPGRCSGFLLINHLHKQKIKKCHGFFTFRVHIGLAAHSGTVPLTHTMNTNLSGKT